MNKKGALELGINTVVVLVIAIIIVGGGIAFVTGIFSKLNANVASISPSILPVQPTPQKPIAISGDTITVKNTGSKTILVGVYNTDPGPLTNAYLNSTKCTGSVKLDVVGLSQTIQPGKIGAYKLIVSPNGATPGETYVCKLQVFSDDYTPTAGVYREIQVNLQVTS